MRLKHIATRFILIDRDTPLLLPPNLRDWVPATITAIQTNIVTSTITVPIDTSASACFYRVEDEVDEMISGHPVAEIGRQEQRGVAVNQNEAGGHVFQTHPLRGCSICLKQSHFLSPTGC